MGGSEFIAIRGFIKVSHSLNSFKGVTWRSTVGAIKGDTRNLDYSSNSEDQFGSPQGLCEGYFEKRPFLQHSPKSEVWVSRHFALECYQDVRLDAIPTGSGFSIASPCPRYPNSSLLPFVGGVPY